MDFRGGGGVNSPFYFGVRGGSGGREPRVCLGELSQPACPSTVPGTCFVISFSPASDSDSSTSRRPLARGLDGVIRVHGGGGASGTATTTVNVAPSPPSPTLSTTTPSSVSASSFFSAISSTASFFFFRPLLSVAHASYSLALGRCRAPILELSVALLDPGGLNRDRVREKEPKRERTMLFVRPSKSEFLFSFLPSFLSILVVIIYSFTPPRATSPRRRPRPRPRPPTKGRSRPCWTGAGFQIWRRRPRASSRRRRRC